jgi:hypothetical protein
VSPASTPLARCIRRSTVVLEPKTLPLGRGTNFKICRN